MKVTARELRTQPVIEEKTMSEANVTTDHRKIKDWVEQRGGRPARVEGTAVKGCSGVILLDYGEPTTLELEEITWNDFFDGFEENELAFLYPDGADGVRFAKLVARDSARVKVRAAS